MKKLLVLVMVLLSASLVFAATGSVNAYTTLEEPLAAAFMSTLSGFQVASVLPVLKQRVQILRHPSGSEV